jgi:uncharacterized protein
MTAAAGKPDQEGKQTITISLSIQKPWHVYANPVGPSKLEASQTTVRILHKGAELDAAIDYPKGKSISDDASGEYQVYEGEVRIAVRVKRPQDADGPLDVELRIQACSGEQCLLKTRLKTTVK